MTKLTPKQIRDAAMKRFNKMAPAKYDQGQHEHGGIITDRDLLREIQKEIIDLWFYVDAEITKRERTQNENHRPIRNTQVRGNGKRVRENN